MRNITIMISLLVLLLGSTGSQAQTRREWFRQNSTQRRYLTKQIGLLQVYLDHLKKGYEITRNGLTVIHTIKSGDFDLHSDFFNSLKNVNPLIAKSARMVNTLTLQNEIRRTLQSINKFCLSNENFTTDEINYIMIVLDNMIDQTDAATAELSVIFNPNKTEMTDDERIKNIERIYSDMLDKYAFVRSLDDDVHLIARERTREKIMADNLNVQVDEY